VAALVRLESHGSQQAVWAVAFHGSAAEDAAIAAKHQKILVAVQAIERKRGVPQKPRYVFVVRGFRAAYAEWLTHG
jgi:hypothetical protein